MYQQPLFGGMPDNSYASGNAINISGEKQAGTGNLKKALRCEGGCAMTSRERIRLLLGGKIPDCMGLYEHFWGETLSQAWPEQGLPQNTAVEDLFGFDIQNAGGWFNTEPFPGRREVLQESDEWIVARDGRGAALKQWKNKSGTPEHIDFEVATRETWNKYREPLLTFNQERLGNIEDAVKALAEIRAKGRFAVYGNLFVFELLRGTLGDENFLPALLLEPEWIRDFCQVYLDHFRTHYEALFRHAGKPDGMFIYEDFGYRNGLFCSPAVMRDLILPFHRQLVGFFKDYGLPVILHSCGDIRKAVPLAIEAGFDCLQPMEAKAGCDVLEFAREYGNRIAYMGNIDIRALETNNPAGVEAEILPKLRELKRLRAPYIFHSDHSIPPTVAYGTYLHALRVFKDNRHYD